MMFPASEKLESVLREIKYRKKVYPRLVEQGKMARSTAEREVRIMEEIAADYREQAQKEQLGLNDDVSPLRAMPR